MRKWFLWAVFLCMTSPSFAWSQEKKSSNTSEDALFAGIGGSPSCDSGRLCTYQVTGSWLSFERSSSVDLYDLVVNTRDDEEDEKDVYRYRGVRAAYIHGLWNRGTVFFRAGLGLEAVSIETGTSGDGAKFGAGALLSLGARAPLQDVFAGIELQQHLHLSGRPPTSAMMLYLGIYL